VSTRAIGDVIVGAADYFIAIFDSIIEAIQL
jgi:hypothetical protein